MRWSGAVDAVYVRTALSLPGSNDVIQRAVQHGVSNDDKQKKNGISDPDKTHSRAYAHSSRRIKNMMQNLQQRIFSDPAFSKSKAQTMSAETELSFEIVRSNFTREVAAW